MSGEAGRKENCIDGASQNALGLQGKSMGGRKSRKRRGDTQQGALAPVQAGTFPFRGTIKTIKAVSL